MDHSFDTGLYKKKKKSRRSGGGREETREIKTRRLWRLPYVTDANREAIWRPEEEKKKKEQQT